MKKKSFKTLKSEFISTLKTAGACEPEFKRIVASENPGEFLQVVVDNIAWCLQKKVVDVTFFDWFGDKLCWKHGIYTRTVDNIKCNGNERIILLGSSAPTIEAWESSAPRIEAWGSSAPTIEAWGSSAPRIVAWESSAPTIVAWESSAPRIEARESSAPRIEAWESSAPRIVAWESSAPTIEAWESSAPTIEAWESSCVTEVVKKVLHVQKDKWTIKEYEL